jgi:hypothetical protein
LSDGEREQIARAAGRLKLPLSGFVRQAALQASAVVEGKVAAKAPERESAGVVVVDVEPPALEVEEPWRPHHFVDGECSGCGLDINDTRGRDVSCSAVMVG